MDTNVITSENLKPVPTTEIPTQTPSTGTPALAQQNLTNEALKTFDLTQKENEIVSSREDITSKMLENIGFLGGESAYRTQVTQQSNIGNLRQELGNLNSQILQKQAEIQQDDTKLVAQMRAEERRDTLLPFAQNAQAKLQGDAQIMRALKTSEIGVLNALALGKQGSIELAKSTIDEAVNAKYAPYREQNAIYEAQLKAIEPLLTAAEKKTANAQKLKIDLAMRQIDKAEANEKGIQELVVTAASQNAPADLLRRANTAKTRSEAAMILGQYAGDYYKTELLKEQLLKTQDERKALGAYATLPTNEKIQENIRIGKITPGQLVSKTTGEIPKNISADKVDGILALKDLTKKVREYEDVYKLFESEAAFGGAGLVTGIKNIPFTSSTKASLDGLRGEIIDLLARARSGAALTAYETKEYEKKLPGAFNTSLGLGTQGTDKISSFKSSLEGTLSTKMDGYGVTFASSAEDAYVDTIETAKSNTQASKPNVSGYVAELNQN